ncbi:MAG: cytochrome b/b6 domain-containing protein [Rhodobacteraceae bacterium]|nr:cytochrome b/b6 domain-containing protein [Paracoccaceae bacterium]
MAQPDTPDQPGLLNTTRRYGSVARGLHWLTALLILTAIPLGIAARQWPYDLSDQLLVKATLFSVHKTLGLATFLVALLRIIWSLSQPRPRMLPVASGWQAATAEVTHWGLYIGMIIVPLSGWLQHAATTGFAPIWWPFGQTLPFIPQSEPVATFFGAWHWLFTKVLAAAILLHILGALKHHYIDRDATLARMLPGHPNLPAVLPAHKGIGTGRAAGAAVAIWALALAGGTAPGLQPPRDASGFAPALARVPSDWVVETGTLEITVQQFGHPVTGRFADWTARISFSESVPAGAPHGAVEVKVATDSLRLGGVTDQATGAEFLNTGAFPTATFTGPVTTREGGGYVIEGTLSLIGRDVPARLPFVLHIENGIATAHGTLTLDRRNFGIGPSYPDAASVGFIVEVAVNLTATRAADTE